MDSVDTNDTCVLIPSCNAFADVHAPFLACFERYWLDCPWKMYGLSESGWGKFPIATITDASWAANLVKGLAEVPEKFVLMFLDDMLICEPVDQTAVDKAAQLVQRCDIGAVRVGPGAEVYEAASDFSDFLGLDSRVGYVLQESRYRISTSPTLWRKEYLASILQSQGVVTAWDFEIKGTMFARYTSKIVLKILDDPPPMQVLYTSITRGAWEEGALQWLRRVGIEVKTDRPIKGRESHQRWPLDEE